MKLTIGYFSFLNCIFFICKKAAIGNDGVIVIKPCINVRISDSNNGFILRKET